VWVRTSYEGLAKQLIHDFKFSRKQAAARPLARMTVECLPFLPPDTIVTHVPTATSRIRQRGYDHAQEFARALAHEHKLTYLPLLARSGKTRQVGSTRKERLTQLDNAFMIIRPQPIKGASILLVDDIVTTGGTIGAVARCLKLAGASQVDAVMFAQKD
jgi:ComF family protein